MLEFFFKGEPVDKNGKSVRGMSRKMKQKLIL